MARKMNFNVKQQIFIACLVLFGCCGCDRDAPRIVKETEEFSFDDLAAASAAESDQPGSEEQ